MRRPFTFAISLLFALLLVGSVWAQEATEEAPVEEIATEEAPAEESTELSYGTPVHGSIDGAQVAQEWTLNTLSADRIQIRVERTDGNLIPDVYVINESGNMIAQSRGSDRTYAVAQIDNFALPTGGTYTVEVTRLNRENGETEGDYSLEVIPLGTAIDNPNNQTIIGEVTIGVPVDGEITPTHWRQLYTYTAQAADAINVVARRMDGTLMPIVEVLDANSAPLGTGRNSDTFADTGRVMLPSAGDYTIAVSRQNAQAGETSGNYELIVNLIGAGENSPLLEGTVETATYDEPLSGSISSARWYEEWQLTTDASDTLTLEVERVDGDLRPEVSLIGGSGQELRRGSVDRTGATAIIDRYRLSGRGDYIIRVSRERGQTGETSGAYTLRVTLNGSGEDNPAFTEPLGEIVFSEPVEGEITAARWENVWTFTGEQNSRIDIIVQRTDGTLSPTLQVRDANGQRLSSGSSSATHDHAEILNYRVPGSGTYQIAVRRENDQNGETVGSYQLTINASAE